jgi:DNA primase
MDTVDLIKAKLSIVEVIAGYIPLTKAGGTFKARCPFHSEKSPSFTVSVARQTYHCFGCAEHGDMFTFVEKIEGTDFKGALKILAQKAGVEITYQGKKDEGTDTKERLFELHDAVTTLYESMLKKERDVFEYLISRGLTQKTITDYRIGFAPNGWQHAYDYLRAKSFTDAEIIASGVCIKKDGEGEARIYDRFRSRIQFPLFDSAGRIIGFSGRIWKGNDTDAKYINSPETPIYHKSNFLYGFHVAKYHIRELKCSILVEGQMDLLACHQAGYTNTVAISGTAFTEDHARLLKRFSDNVILSLDADSAGVTAARKAALILIANGMDVKVTYSKSKESKDPSDIVKSGGVEALKSHIKSAVPIVDFVLQYIDTTEDSTLKKSRAIEKELLPLVATIPSQIEREQTLKYIERKTDISYNALATSIQSIAQTHIQSQPVAHRESTALISIPPEYALSYILRYHTEHTAQIDSYCSENQLVIPNRSTSRI